MSTLHTARNHISPLFQFQKVRLWVFWVRWGNRAHVFQFQKVRLWETSILIGSSAAIFQFQKVRLWECSATKSIKTFCISIPKGAIMSSTTRRADIPVRYFNSKRCDYELRTSFIIFIKSDFNSKRCDYEARNVAKHIVWVYFNSKRCDYEELSASTLS